MQKLWDFKLMHFNLFFFKIIFLALTKKILQNWFFNLEKILYLFLMQTFLTNAVKWFFPSFFRTCGVFARYHLTAIFTRFESCATRWRGPIRFSLKLNRGSIHFELLSTGRNSENLILYKVFHLDTTYRRTSLVNRAQFYVGIIIGVDSELLNVLARLR